MLCIRFRKVNSCPFQQIDYPNYFCFFLRRKIFNKTFYRYIPFFIFVKFDLPSYKIYYIKFDILNQEKLFMVVLSPIPLRSFFACFGKKRLTSPLFPFIFFILSLVFQLWAFCLELSVLRFGSMTLNLELRTLNLFPLSFQL